MEKKRQQTDEVGLPGRHLTGVDHAREDRAGENGLAETTRPKRSGWDVLESKYFDLFESAPLGNLALENNTTIAEANLSACRILGMEKIKLIGCALSQFVVPEEQPLFHNCLMEALYSQTTSSTVIRMVRSDGTTFDAQLETAASNEDCGAMKGFRISLSDVTARKRAEDELRELDRQLLRAQKEESLQRMAGAVAHHFNNLLCVVMGNLELAIDESPRGSNLQKLIKQAMIASHRAAEISQLMLCYVGASSGRKRLIDLMSTTKEALSSVTGSLPKSAVLQTELPAVSVIIMGVERHVKQVVINLLLNAMEAIGSGEGEIRVSVRVLEAGEISASRFYPTGWMPKARAYAVLTVSDTGCGLDDLTIERIFDPFFSTKCVGRGLGLSVALGLARQHEGAIAVESQPRQGATFRLFLPLADSYILQARKS
ncbi:MAG: nitrogen regulation protein NR(II) [Syntrophobacteraceae bacterium]